MPTMKSACCAALLAVLLGYASEAAARPMSTMEWMDPKGFEIWKSLSAPEKAESVKSMVDQSGGAQKPEEKDYLVGKGVACVDREAADPDYKGVPVPLYIPWSYCIAKYSAILENKTKE